MKPVLWIKLLMLRLRIATPLREFCKDCGVSQPLIWHAANDLWAEVRDASIEDDGGVLCPWCFDRRARKRGIYLCWVPTAELQEVRHEDGHE